jgi:CheY-like chemotaxis protein
MARVLVVEDEDVTRELLELRLSGAGHWVRTAASVDEARTAMHRGRPEVLVSDMFMPGGSGLALVSSLREDPESADLPVVFLSGRALPGDVAAGEALGASYLTKPASLEALERAIDAAIEASPPALMTAVRDRLVRLGVEAGEEERDVVLLLIDLFVDGAPEGLAAAEAALESGDDAALGATVARLGRAAAHLGAAPLARLCADLEDRARSSSLPPAAAVRAALRRDLTVTCRVLGAVAAELAPTRPRHLAPVG